MIICSRSTFSKVFIHVWWPGTTHHDKADHGTTADVPYNSGCTRVKETWQSYIGWTVVIYRGRTTIVEPWFMVAPWYQFVLWRNSGQCWKVTGSREKHRYIIKLLACPGMIQFGLIYVHRHHVHYMLIRLLLCYSSLSGILWKFTWIWQKNLSSYFPREISRSLHRVENLKMATNRIISAPHYSNQRGIENSVNWRTLFYWEIWTLCRAYYAE